MTGTLRLRGCHVFSSDGRGAHWKVDVKHSPAGQTIAFHAVPAPQGGRRDAEIVSYSLDRIVLPDSINRKVSRVSLHITAGVLARRNRDDQLRTGVEVGG